MKLRIPALLLMPALALPLASSAIAGEADVLEAHARRAMDDTYRFTVTVRHADTGWEHYADRWEVLDREGNLLGHRTLHHPHVDEQPFTRVLTGVEIPPGVPEVHIRARDSVHGYGGREVAIPLPP